MSLLVLGNPNMLERLSNNTPNYIGDDYFSIDWFRYPRLGPTLPAFEFTEADKRKISWMFEGHGKLKPLCAYYRNTERGLECTARNCPCELYEADI